MDQRRYFDPDTHLGQELRNIGGVGGGCDGVRTCDMRQQGVLVFCDLLVCVPEFYKYRVEVPGSDED